MYGSGHDGSSTVHHFGKNAAVGDVGEDYFGKGLVNAGLTRFEAFHTLGIPARSNQAKLRGDVDWVVANGREVVLIDVKRWSGRYLWSVPGVNLPLDGVRPYRMRKQKNGPKVWAPLSQNMAAALDRYRSALPHANVTAMVVFVPTVNGDRDSGPRDVRFLRWPGGINSYTAGEGFTELKRRLNWPEVVEVPSEIMSVLTGLRVRTQR